MLEMDDIAIHNLVVVLQKFKFKKGTIFSSLQNMKENKYCKQKN